MRNHLFNARKVLRRELLRRYPEYAEGRRSVGRRSEAGDELPRLATLTEGAGGDPWVDPPVWDGSPRPPAVLPGLSPGGPLRDPVLLFQRLPSSAPPVSAAEPTKA